MSFTATVLLEGDEGDLAGAAEVEVRGDTFHHLFQVKRLDKEATLRVVDGRGLARRGTIGEIRRDRALLRLGETLATREPERRLRLIVGALKPERASWLVEKATELGVAGLVFVACERTPRQYSEGRLDRLRRVAAAALEQCHGARLPTLEGVFPWSALPALLGDSRHALVLAPDAEPGPLAAPPDVREVDVFIGPEGGFTPAELAQLAAHGVRAVGLGPRILRVETAALAAAALLLLGAEPVVPST